MKRLLHVFPLASVKEKFDKKGNSESVIEEITEEQTQKTIKDFAFENYPQTRQNIYVYELDDNFPHENFVNDEFTHKVEHRQTQDQELTIHCLPITIFQILIGRTGQNVELSFIQPFVIRVIGNKLVIHFTKIVRNVSSYFPEEDTPIKKGQVNNEATLLASILDYFAEFNPTPLDINAGVKQLWEANDVDCYKVLSRKKSSAVMETMDGETMFKEQYPADYLVIIQRPLEKTVFKYLLVDGYLCGEFTTEPTIGRISINQFPANVNQAKNVVSKILANN